VLKTPVAVTAVSADRLHRYVHVCERTPYKRFVIVAVFVPVTLRMRWPLAEKGIPIQHFCRWFGHTPKGLLEFSM
jgi:hypothetical protein